MKFGIIGFGVIARKFVESIRVTDGEVYAIASKSLKNDDAYLLKNPNVVVYQNYEDLLKDEQVEAVYIAVPHKFHKEWVLKALDYKKAVLCEKPAVLSVVDMQEIKAKAIETNTYFLEALKTKLNDGMDQLKKDLKMIGTIHTIDANFCVDARSLRGSTSFLYDEAQGGCLNDIGPYVIGFVLDIANSKVVQVSSFIKKFEGIEEHFNATLVHENGIKSSIEAAIDENKERVAVIIGTEGKITVPMFNRIIDYKIKLKDGRTIYRNFPFKGNDMSKQIQCLIDDVNNNKIENNIHTMDHVVEILEVIEKIRQ